MVLVPVQHDHCRVRADPGGKKGLCGAATLSDAELSWHNGRAMDIPCRGDLPGERETEQ